jgi:hypothetical protein
MIDATNITLWVNDRAYKQLSPQYLLTEAEVLRILANALDTRKSLDACIENARTLLRNAP